MFYEESILSGKKGHKTHKLDIIFHSVWKIHIDMRLENVYVFAVFADG